MREVNLHHCPGVPDAVRIFPEGDPGPGGAPTQYRLALGLPGQETGTSVMLKFQNGSLKDTGPNGITLQAIIAVCIDRLQEFQKNPKVSCRENAIAQTYLETALLWMHKRTQDRVERGVEGEVKS